jgi:ABC-2 type transport system permease protein
VDGNIQSLVHSGGFLTFMLRPVSYRFYAFSQKIGHRLMAFWVEVLPVYLLFLWVFKVRLVPHSLFWAVLSLMLSFIMMFQINYCIGTMGFWLTRTNGIGRMFLLARSVFAGSFIPLNFFPDVVQKIMFFLPFQFITYVPIRVFLGSYTLGGVTLPIPAVVALQAAEVAAMYGVSEFLWRKGVRQFTGVGA